MIMLTGVSIACDTCPLRLAISQKIYQNQKQAQKCARTHTRVRKHAHALAQVFIRVYANTHMPWHTYAHIHMLDMRICSHNFTNPFPAHARRHRCTHAHTRTHTHTHAHTRTRSYSRLFLETFCHKFVIIFALKVDNQAQAYARTQRTRTHSRHTILLPFPAHESLHFHVFSWKRFAISW